MRTHLHLIFAIFVCVVSLAGASALAQPYARIDIAAAPPAPNHIRFIYAVPALGTDRRLDVTGTLHRAIDDMQIWLLANSGGMRLRVREVAGMAEILFVRLQLRESELEGPDVPSRRLIERELQRRGLLRPDELYSIL